MINPTCIELYFNPIYIYIRNAFTLAFNNNFAATIMSSFIVTALKVVESFFEIKFFGVSNALLLLVILTVLIDAYWGVKKSRKQSREALNKSLKLDVESSEYKKQIKKFHLKKFRPEKLQFTFFKCLTLLSYLFFVSVLLNTDEDGAISEIIGFTSSAILKVPLAIFWYYDFKSIGDNAAYIHGNKAPIFKIVEYIFEMKFSEFMKKDK